MKFSTKILSLIALIAAAFAVSSCESGRSYSEMLNDENRAVNRFLADQWVFAEIPADSAFLVGAEAPYYQIDGEGNIYMQVLEAPTKLVDGEKVLDRSQGVKAQDDQLIYFRFLRYNLMYYAGDLDACPSEGNQNDMAQAPTSFRFQNYTLPSSSQWGSGIQLPLEFLPIGSEVNLVVKSQYGWTSEISNVQPFLYHIRYYKSQI